MIDLTRDVALIYHETVVRDPERPVVLHMPIAQTREHFRTIEQAAYHAYITQVRLLLCLGGGYYRLCAAGLADGQWYVVAEGLIPDWSIGDEADDHRRVKPAGAAEEVAPGAAAPAGALDVGGDRGNRRDYRTLQSGRSASNRGDSGSRA